MLGHNGSIQARASEGVLATRGPGGQMLLSDSRRAETAEAAVG